GRARHVGPQERGRGVHRRPRVGPGRLGRRRHALRDPVRNLTGGSGGRDETVLRPGGCQVAWMTAPVRRSPIARMHAELGASFESEWGWEVAASYGDEAGERSALAGTVALVDVTPRGKIDLRGRIDRAIGAGGGTLCARVADDWALLLTGPGGEEPLLGTVEGAAGPGAMVTDATHL